MTTSPHLAYQIGLAKLDAAHRATGLLGILTLLRTAR
jgi:hypothetical protein